MARNRAVKLSLGQVARLSLLSASLIILILFNVSQANPQVSSSANSTGGEDPRLDGTSGMPANVSTGGGGGGGTNETANSRELGIHNEDAKRGQYPFHVGVYLGEEYRCGGVLLDVGRVLTLAHCVDISQVGANLIKVGDLDRSINDGEQTLAVEQVRLSPNSSLAMLFTKEEVIIGDGEPGGLSPAWPMKLLPNSPQTPRGELIVVGWGRPSIGGEIPNELRAALINPSECRRQKMEGYFCSRQDDPINGRGICGGYTGGPVLDTIRVMDSLIPSTLVGLVDGYSCKDRCQDPECDYEFINISHHLDWIFSTVRHRTDNFSDKL